MGNSWKGINEVTLLESEKKILSYSGIPLEEFKIENVNIGEDGSYVRTTSVGDVSYFIHFSTL